MIGCLQAIITGTDIQAITTIGTQDIITRIITTTIHTATGIRTHTTLITGIQITGGTGKLCQWGDLTSLRSLYFFKESRIYAK